MRLLVSSPTFPAFATCLVNKCPTGKNLTLSRFLPESTSQSTGHPNRAPCVSCSAVANMKWSHTTYVQNNVRSCAEEINGKGLSKVETEAEAGLQVRGQPGQHRKNSFPNKQISLKRKKTKTMKKSKPNKQINKTTNHLPKQASKTQEALEPELQCDLLMGLCWRQSLSIFKWSVSLTSTHALPSLTRHSRPP